MNLSGNIDDMSTPKNSNNYHNQLFACQVIVCNIFQFLSLQELTQKAAFVSKQWNSDSKHPSSFCGNLNINNRMYQSINSATLMGLCHAKQLDVHLAIHHEKKRTDYHSMSQKISSLKHFDRLQTLTIYLDNSSPYGYSNKRKFEITALMFIPTLIYLSKAIYLNKGYLRMLNITLESLDSNNTCHDLCFWTRNLIKSAFVNNNNNYSTIEMLSVEVHDCSLSPKWDCLLLNANANTGRQLQNNNSKWSDKSRNYNLRQLNLVGASYGLLGLTISFLSQFCHLSKNLKKLTLDGMEKNGQVLKNFLNKLSSSNMKVAKMENLEYLELNGCAYSREFVSFLNNFINFKNLIEFTMKTFYYFDFDAEQLETIQPIENYVHNEWQFIDDLKYSKKLKYFTFETGIYLRFPIHFDTIVPLLVKIFGNLVYIKTIEKIRLIIGKKINPFNQNYCQLIKNTLNKKFENLKVFETAFRKNCLLFAKQLLPQSECMLSIVDGIDCAKPSDINAFKPLDHLPIMVNQLCTASETDLYIASDLSQVSFRRGTLRAFWSPSFWQQLGLQNSPSVCWNGIELLFRMHYPSIGKDKSITIPMDVYYQKIGKAITDAINPLSKCLDGVRHHFIDFKICFRAIKCDTNKTLRIVENIKWNFNTSIMVDQNKYCSTVIVMFENI